MTEREAARIALALVDAVVSATGRPFWSSPEDQRRLVATAEHAGPEEPEWFREGMALAEEATDGLERLISLQRRGLLRPASSRYMNFSKNTRRDRQRWN